MASRGWVEQSSEHQGPEGKVENREMETACHLERVLKIEGRFPPHQLRGTIKGMWNAMKQRKEIRGKSE